MKDVLWNIAANDEPLVATAIHDGHRVRREVSKLLHISESDRLREQDPHTGTLAKSFRNHIIPGKSRFEVDLNRPRERAVYVDGEDAWGLKVWKKRPHDGVIMRSLKQYDDFYTELHRIYSEMSRRFGKFVVFDIHSYNHRRGGPHAEPEHSDGHPEVNVGTGTMDRDRWSGIVDRFIHELRSFESGGRRLDVRENIKFYGGNHANWSHQTFPDSACVIAIEFKKFFMDEWSGEVYEEEFRFIREALESTIEGVTKTVRAIAKGKYATR
jgi:hypothetical protein